MKNYLRALIHVGTIGAVSTAAVHLLNGQAITAGNVVIPGLMGFLGAVLHAAMPDLTALDSKMNSTDSAK